MKSISKLIVTQVRYPFAKGLKQPLMRINQSAVERLRQIMSNRQENNLVGVKISLTKKGCSGLSYSMKYICDEEIKRLDEVVETAGIKVVVDSKAVMALIGTEMKY